MYDSASPKVPYSHRFRKSNIHRFSYPWIQLSTNPEFFKWRTALLRGHCSLYIFHILLWKLIRTMMSIFKRPLFLVSKISTILLFLILVAGVTPVIATSKQPKFRASSMYSSQSNRPVQPSGPNPCSFLPGSGQCKPPKWCMFDHA
jgi:hypothetical protein